MDEHDPTPDPTVVVVCDVADLDAPSMRTLDVLARMQLAARRSGGELRLRGAPEALQALLELCGLRDVLPSDGEREELDD